MGKFFPASSRHAKARAFLELRQEAMTILEYLAKFTKLAHFRDDYMATYMAKGRKFEDGLKLSIGGKIIGLLLQDVGFMVKTTLAIERDPNDAASEMRVLVIRGRRTIRLLLAQERSRGLLLHEGFRDKVTNPRAKARISHPKMGGTSGLLASHGRECVSTATSLDS